jgi:hypothetical protein
MRAGQIKRRPHDDKPYRTTESDLGLLETFLNSPPVSRKGVHFASGGEISFNLSFLNLSNNDYIYPSFLILSMASSLSCRLPARSSVFSKSCSHAGTPSIDIWLVVLAPKERYPRS